MKLGSMVEFEINPDPEYPTEAEFIKVTINRISGSGNIIAKTEKAGIKHIHVDHGTIGETAIALIEDGDVNAASSGEDTAKLLNYKEVNDAIINYNCNKSCELKKGDFLKLNSSDYSHYNHSNITIKKSEYNINEIEHDDFIDRQTDELLLKISEISGEKAYATVKKTNIPSKSKKSSKKPNRDSLVIKKRPWSRSNSKKQGSQSPNNGSDTENPFKNQNGEYSGPNLNGLR